MIEFGDFVHITCGDYSTQDGSVVGYVGSETTTVEVETDDGPQKVQIPTRYLVKF